MKKWYLVNGTIIRNRANDYYVVIADKLVNLTTFYSLKNYKDDLTHITYSFLDIVEIYMCKTNNVNPLKVLSNPKLLDNTSVWYKKTLTRDICWSEIKIDTPVRIRYQGIEIIRHFSGRIDKNGDPEFWISGYTSYNTNLTISLKKDKHEFEIIK